MLKQILLLILLIILFYNNVFSHTIYPAKDFNEILKSSVRYEKKDILPLTAFLGISTLLFLTDYSLKKNVQKLKNSEMDTVLEYSKYFGDGLFILGLASLNIIVGETLNKKYTLLGIYMLEGFVISGLFVTGIKFIVGRERPYVDNDPNFYKPFNLETSYKSFYSGHTTEAFTLASVISHFFKNVYVSTIVYTIASLTAIERVYNNKHWPSDVFIGCVTGILIGRKIVQINKNSDEFKVDEENVRISFKIKEF